MNIEKYMPLLLLTSIIAISSTCSKMIQDDRLSLTRTNYSGNELRIDGYYYFMTEDNLHFTYFFYRNGIAIHGGGNAPNTSPIEFIESQFMSESYIAALKEHKTHGVYSKSMEMLSKKRHGTHLREGRCHLIYALEKYLMTRHS